MKILLVGRKFGGVAGGVERMAILLMNAMVSRGHQVDLLTWDQAGAQTYYPLNESIRWWMLNMGDPMRRANWMLRIKRLLRIREVVKQVSPDVIIAFQHGPFLTVRLSIVGLGIPIIAAERNAPHRFDYLRAGGFQQVVYLTFLLATKVTIQFDTYRERYPWFLQKRLISIPNPVAPKGKRIKVNKPEGNKKVLLFVGRLSYQKNPEVLVKAFSLLGKDSKDWSLHIVGEGEAREKVEQLLDQLKLMEKAKLLGTIKDIDEVYKKADLICLPSRWEGFPNVLAEALAYGLPAVGFAECAGTNLLILHGKNGLLVEGNDDPRMLADGLSELMKDDEARKRMGDFATTSMRQYDPDEIFSKWNQLFLESAGKGIS